MTFDKAISPAYEYNGRRKRLVGYIGQITDESGVVLHNHEYSTYGQAENALNAVVYDLLTDYAERGLVDPPADAPGDDCPDHGPYADDDCPKCCTTCDGEWRCGTCLGFGWLPCNGGYGDQAGGYAETCPDCSGIPAPSMLNASPPVVPLFDDVARVIDMALGKSHGAASVVAELRRVRARLAEIAAPSYHVVSQSPFCAQPDNLCSVHDPCPAHAADAARFLAQPLPAARRATVITADDLPF